MAWNRPSKNLKTGSKAKPKKIRLPLALALGGIAAIVGITAFLFSSESNGQRQESKSHELIREVEPAITKKAVETNTVNKVDPNARPTKVGEKLNGYIMLPDGSMHKIYGEITNRLSRSRAELKIFHRMSDKLIAGLLLTKPGQNYVGTPHYNGRFTKDFLESLKEPIIVSQDDTDEEKALKRAVNAAKIEFKAAYDRGEDIEELLLREREEFRRLAKYKLDLRKQVLDYSNKEAMTEQDVDDMLSAANKMLEARGIAPLEGTPLTRIKLKLKENLESDQEKLK